MRRLVFRPEFRDLRQLHLRYMRRCWKDCVNLADSLILSRSDDPADQDVRRDYVFQLAKDMFSKHTFDIYEFCNLFAGIFECKRRRKSKRRRDAKNKSKRLKPLSSHRKTRVEHERIRQTKHAQVRKNIKG